MKRRIFLGIAPMLVLVIGIGIYAVVLFKDLGGKIDMILKANFRSIVAGEGMKESLERMNSALYFSLAGEDVRGRQQFAKNQPIFQSNLDAELGNITLPGEQELADETASNFKAYVAKVQQFWAGHNPADKRALYFTTILPLSDKIRVTAQKIIQINEDNMVRADGEARRVSAMSTRYMVLAVLVTVAGSLFFASRLQRSILRPVETLRSVAKELGDGNLDQVVPVQSGDEFGQLADSFNKMASKLRAYRQVTTDQILQARQMTEIAFSAFPDPIIAYSIEGNVNFLNPAAEKLLVKIPTKNNLPEGVADELDQVLQGGPDLLPTSFEKAILVRVDEQETFLLPRVVGMRDENGHVFGAAVILQDVTRFRLLDEVKTNLVSTVSHELKTPLTSVRMGLHLLLEERIGPLTPKQTELLLAAREDSERLLRMLNDLLDLAKLESGKTRPVLEKVYPRQLVETALEDLAPVIESHGCKLSVRVSPSLPLVEVDPQQIHHVFSNLVSNAAKHSKAGQEILVQAIPAEGHVRFSVTDHGPGIPLEFQSKIFDRFFRLPGTEPGGAGLGLAIAREIVLSQGGRVGVNSTPGQGSEFYFELPALKKISV